MGPKKFSEGFEDSNRVYNPEKGIKTFIIFPLKYTIFFRFFLKFRDNLFGSLKMPFFQGKNKRIRRVSGCDFLVFLKNQLKVMQMEAGYSKKYKFTN